MKKHNNLTALVWGLMGVGLVLWAGCSNIFSPPTYQEGSTATGGSLEIRIDSTRARTLYPDSGFERYELSFSRSDKGGNRNPITLDEGKTSTTIDNLDDGEWTISAIGYVSTNSGGSFPGAVGEKTVKVENSVVYDNGKSIDSISIQISASNDESGPEGYFYYSIQYPRGQGNTESRLSLTKVGDEKPIKTEYMYDSKNSGSYTLKPGYYILQLLLDREGQTLGRTEVVHIYSYMETRYERTFVVTDFTGITAGPAITLSGTASLTINGKPFTGTQDQAFYVLAVMDGGGIGGAIVEGGVWSMEYDSPEGLTFYLSIGEGERVFPTGITWTVGKPTDSIKLDVSVSTTVWNGTVKDNGKPLSGEAVIAAFRSRPQKLDEAAYAVLIGATRMKSDGSWSFDVPTTETSLWFAVIIGEGDNGSIYFTTSAISNTAGIVLDISQMESGNNPGEPKPPKSDIDPSLIGYWKDEYGIFTLDITDTGITWGGLSGSSMQTIYQSLIDQGYDAAWVAKDGTILCIYEIPGSGSTGGEVPFYDYRITGGKLELLSMGYVISTLTK